MREVREETGVEVRVQREVGTVQRPAPSGDTYVIRDFLCSTVGDFVVVAADDAADACFFEIEEVGHLSTSEGLIDALQEWDLLPRI